MPSGGARGRGVSRKPEEIASIQVLRAVAALAVFVGHLSTELYDTAHWDPLPHITIPAGGVDLFFVISGFIMVHTSRDMFGRATMRREFVRRRLIRIVPLYWMISGVLAAHAIVRYGAAGLTAANLSPGLIISSFFFVPWPRPDGDMTPLLAVGWTLSYEMFFYLLFALSLALPRRAAVGATAFMLLAAVAVAVPGGGPPGPSAGWPALIAVEFIYGMAIALLASHVKLSRAATLSLLGVGGAGLVLVAQASPQSEFRFALWGIPCALVVAGATLHKFPLASRVWTPLIVLGNASYALYLVHPFMNVPRLAARRIFGIAPEPWLDHPIPYGIALVALMIGVALAVHFLVEKPVIRMLRRWSRRDPSPALARPAQ
jgi:peptidoglycan/LPS O-acetylase OafA/YrhL